MRLSRRYVGAATVAAIGSFIAVWALVSVTGSGAQPLAETTSHESMSSLSDAAGEAGYEPVQATVVPAGYELADVIVSRSPRAAHGRIEQRWSNPSTGDGFVIIQHPGLSGVDGSQPGETLIIGGRSVVRVYEPLAPGRLHASVSFFWRSADGEMGIAVNGPLTESQDETLLQEVVAGIREP